MKILYKLATEIKFRGIFKNNEVPKASSKNKETTKQSKESSDKDNKQRTEKAKKDASNTTDTEKEEMYERMAGLLGVPDFGKKMEDVWTLLFGDIGEVMNLFNKEKEGAVEEKEGENKRDKNNNDQNLDLDYSKNDKLHAQEAYNLLNRSIIVRSSEYGIVRPPEVAPRQDPKGTSLEGIRKKTILGINELQKKINIPLVITGGTEAGHAGGLSNQPGTHGDGSKVDISFDNGVKEKMDQYIASKKPVVSDTKIGKKYKFEDGAYTYTIIKEDDHYDIKIS